MTNKVGTNLISVGIIFHRIGPMTEKIGFLGPQNILVAGTHNMFLLLDLMGWVDIEREAISQWPRVTKGLVGDSSAHLN